MPSQSFFESPGRRPNRRPARQPVKSPVKSSSGTPFLALPYDIRTYILLLAGSGDTAWPTTFAKETSCLKSPKPLSPDFAISAMYPHEERVHPNVAWAVSQTCRQLRDEVWVNINYSSPHLMSRRSTWKTLDRDTTAPHATAPLHDRSAEQIKKGQPIKYCRELQYSVADEDLWTDILFAIDATSDMDSSINKTKAILAATFKGHAKIAKRVRRVSVQLNNAEDKFSLQHFVQAVKAYVPHVMEIHMVDTDTKKRMIEPFQGRLPQLRHLGCYRWACLQDITVMLGVRVYDWGLVEGKYCQPDWTIPPSQHVVIINERLKDYGGKMPLEIGM